MRTRQESCIVSAFPQRHANPADDYMHVHACEIHAAAWIQQWRDEQLGDGQVGILQCYLQRGTRHALHITRASERNRHACPTVALNFAERQVT